MIVPGFEFDMEYNRWEEVPCNKVESRLHAYTTKKQLNAESGLAIVITHGKLSFLVDKGNTFLDVNDEEATHATETKETAMSLLQRWLLLHGKQFLLGDPVLTKLMMMDDTALIEDEDGPLRYSKVEEMVEKPSVKISAQRKKPLARSAANLTVGGERTGGERGSEA